MRLGYISNVTEVEHNLGHGRVLALEYISHEGDGGGRLVSLEEGRPHHKGGVNDCQLELLGGWGGREGVR